jgi:hypothetical protein
MNSPRIDKKTTLIHLCKSDGSETLLPDDIERAIT